ncbi:sensor histidine kinase [Weissella sagaensis]|uniref:sensor histidine kinase n=1 Tax=Weissella sagaensis TaxID=2559928 RepID=UPI00123A7A8A|nr:HAMP domain-containing sensor histidine kinase [Weissella sagaensis]KAA8435060.1 HAMP domain-containing histidine kinase [Weissella paramesenteroides]KAA8438951.1 HAMP domain-containing histidine kinase [Weissella paramesenteroides]
MKNRWLEIILKVLSVLLFLLTSWALINSANIAFFVMLVIVIGLLITTITLVMRQKKVTVQQANEIAALKQQIVEQRDEEATMLANVSHEMRTPLTTITGLAEGLQYGVMDGNEQRSYDLIKEEADRLTRLVKSVLSFERMRQGNAENQAETFNVTLLIGELIEKMWPQANKFGNEIQNLCEPDVYVYAAVDQVERILINILANAIQFTKNGIITVSAKDVAGKTHLFVTDTGIGMTANQIDRMWQRYYKADPSRTIKGESGLGMSIVRELIKANNGEIKVTSKVDVGTTFEVILPQKLS